MFRSADKEKDMPRQGRTTINYGRRRRKKKKGNRRNVLARTGLHVVEGTKTKLNDKNGESAGARHAKTTTVGGLTGLLSKCKRKN